MDFEHNLLVNDKLFMKSTYHLDDPKKIKTAFNKTE